MAMSVFARATLATAIVAIIAIAAAYVWYNYTGWTSFQAATGTNLTWQPAGGADVSRLRFRNCTFTVARGDGVTRSADVTAVLNGMAVAYKGGTNNPALLALTRPLNPFSFTIVGFNDAATVTDPGASPWCTSSPPACASDAQCPLPVAGACVIPAGATSGTCGNCTGGAVVTLTGQSRTI
jgi:hypothetical protein